MYDNNQWFHLHCLAVHCILSTAVKWWWWWWSQNRSKRVGN